MAITLDALMQEASSSISPPKNAFLIRQLLENEGTTVPDIALAVEQEPTLATAVMRMANSSLFGGKLRVGSVTRAITRLGTVQTEELVTAISVVRTFKGKLPDPDWEKKFWQNAAYAAGSARLIAYLAKLDERDSAFTAGLLHNIGELVIATQLPDEAARIREQCAAGTPQLEAEHQTLGFDHTEVGSSLAKAWSLPDTLVSCIRHHHTPSSHANGSTLTWVTHAAIGLTEMLILKSDKLADVAALDPLTWKMLGLDEEGIPGLMRALNALTTDLNQIVSV